MLDLHVPKIIAYLVERVLLFLYLSSFPIHSIQETSMLEGVIMQIFCCLLDIDHEITLKIFEVVLNSIEKVKPGFSLSSMCIFSESNGTKS